MAVTKKGWRPIEVNGGTFFWRALGRDYGIDVVVVTAQAFERGRSQHLHFVLRYAGAPQQTAVSPGVVRRAIEMGCARQPPFTGSDGEKDLLLTSAETDEFQRLGQMSG